MKINANRIAWAAAAMVACVAVAAGRQRPKETPIYQTATLTRFNQDTISGWVLPRCYGEAVVTCYGGGEVETGVGRVRYYVNIGTEKLKLVKMTLGGDPLAWVPEGGQFFYRVEERKGRQHFFVRWPNPYKPGRYHEAEYHMTPM